jgi:hypothetical protein
MHLQCVSAVAFSRHWQLRVNKVKQMKSGINAEQKSVAHLI